MRTITCDLCDYKATWETFEDWMKALKPHYMSAHLDVINDPNNWKEEMEKWMVDNRKRFEKNKAN